MKKAACYLRVSTEEQDAANQLEEVESLARARGYEPVIYGETGSAAKDRPVFTRMMADVRAGKVAAVIVWALDRMERNMTALVNDLAELRRLNVRLLSVRETWLDTSNDNPMAPLLVAVFGWSAEFERRRLRERTLAGLARAKKAGKTLGRPRVPTALLQLGVERVKAGGAVKATAEAVGISERSLRRALKATA